MARGRLPPCKTLLALSELMALSATPPLRPFRPSASMHQRGKGLARLFHRRRSDIRRDPQRSPNQVSRMPRGPPARGRLHSMWCVRVLAMRVNLRDARLFQWKRSDLNSRLRDGPVEGGLKEI